MIFRGTVYSKSLGMDTSLTVIGPSELLPGEPYPVIYLLHGLHGNSDNWADNSLLPVYARKYRALFVMPEAGRSFYADMKYGPRYFRYITEELPRICKGLFNISDRREDTAIMGGSMGGYGALRCAFSRPEQYGACAAFSSACLFFQEHLDLLRAPEGAAKFKTAFGEQLMIDFKAIFGEGLVSGPEYEIAALAARVAESGPRPRLYMACGLQDYLYAYNCRFRDTLAGLAYDFSYEEWEGQHDWFFFNEALRRAIVWLLGAQGDGDARRGRF